MMNEFDPVIEGFLISGYIQELVVPGICCQTSFSSSVIDHSQVGFLMRYSSLLIITTLKYLKMYWNGRHIVLRHQDNSDIGSYRSIYYV
ncbi:MAG: hypothetical protein CVV33_10215 [Methanomicrobiales archaeon HGW-Methanomicrobiales-4]|nr:MAG: hypothetical protein CVV33_10215 [Methanomicrobiales archaeon HGW-Methanomicrobiales-4]